MKAEIITIGDEILIGQITDTNSKWIAQELNKIGISVYQITSIQDKKKHILSTLKSALKRVDIIIITGGLGPTNDDITKLTLTQFFEDTLIMNHEIENHIKNLFAKINYPFTELNRQQALVPSKCVAFKNYLGTAPAMWFDKDKKVVISLPGVPYEMKDLMQRYILPKLAKTYKLPFIVHKTVLTQGMGESMVAERLEKWENELPKFIKLAYLPSFGKVRLRLLVKGKDKDILEESIEKEINKLLKIIPDIFVGMEDVAALENQIGSLLSRKNLTLAVAESCTGGSIAKKITAVPGASNYFKGAIVAYSAAIKINELNVSKNLIEKHTVVSAEVAKAMAMGIQQKFNANFAIATTGNAGPTTDKTDETVGTVYIAIASPKTVRVSKFSFGQPREKVIEKTTNKALEMLKKEILKN